MRIPLSSGAPYQEGQGETIIGEVAAHQLGIQEGQALSLDGSEVRVTGVFRTGSRLLDGGLMMGIPEAQRALTQEGQPRQYSLAILPAGDDEAAARLISEINESSPGLKAIPGTEFAGAMRLMRVVDAFVKTLSVVALVGTCLVVINTLLMAIGERTREIGILMTVGWTPLLVLRMFLVESLVLCMAGAALGNAFALLLLRVLNGIESIGFGWIPIHYPFSLTLESFAMALSVAVISLVWPAIILFRVQPLAAIRQE
jgi:putative ABC transport system permease protein